MSLGRMGFVYLAFDATPDTARSGELAGQAISSKREMNLPGDTVLGTFMEICPV